MLINPVFCALVFMTILVTNAKKKTKKNGKCSRKNEPWGLFSGAETRLDIRISKAYGSKGYKKVRI